MESKYLLIETIDATNNQHMNNDNTRRVETGEEHLDGLENEEEETVNWRWFASETDGHLPQRQNCPPSTLDERVGTRQSCFCSGGSAAVERFEAV
jgi:hypothetical protein